MRLLLLLPALLATSCADPDAHVLDPVESSPQVIGGLEVSVVTERVWRVPGSSEQSVLLQLRLRNPTQQPTLFPTFDTFQPKLTGASGTPIEFSGGRDHTRITPRILLAAGSSFSYPLLAFLRRDPKRGSPQVVYQDHTGTILTASLQPGRYSLQFELFPTRNSSLQKGLPGVPLWSAKGITNSVAFQIAE